MVKMHCYLRGKRDALREQLEWIDKRDKIVLSIYHINSWKHHIKTQLAEIETRIAELEQGKLESKEESCFEKGGTGNFI